MTINVKFLSEQIERDAQALLDGYFHELGKPVQIPVPAEDILELHLGLSLDFDDLQAVLGIPDVLGALWADRREVFIDQSLEPGEHPDKEGRYHFSVGHEIGHWRLHRQYLTKAGGQVAMFTDSQPEPMVICRTSQAKERIEWQADYFSSCFLMPRQHLMDAWCRCYGNLRPIVYADVADQNWTQRPDRRRGPVPINTFLSGAVDAIAHAIEPHVHCFDVVAREFAPLFKVSRQAMRIRLENLGLLQINHTVEQDLFGGF